MFHRNLYSKFYRFLDDLICSGFDFKWIAMHQATFKHLIQQQASNWNQNLSTQIEYVIKKTLLET